MRIAAGILSCFLVSFGGAAFAQDRPNTILVMDGSGSMWGQIDGVAKITIAQDVVSELLATLPAEDRLGLTVYGHRERGSCTDIETVVAPAEGTREAIANAVQGIKPLGKTPMTDAVIAAAEALRYTEDSATVILVSDGVETCNPDPCAAARLLEEAAIDFTAHVIGFDVGGDAEAIAQMQCIAEETGGMFIPAADAGELSAALTTVVEEPEPVSVEMTFTAVIGDDKRLIESPVLWDINDVDVVVLEDAQDNPLAYELVEGAYVASAYSLELEETVNVNFVVIDGGSTAVEAVFDEPPLTARLIAPETVPGGATFPVGWEGPNAQYDNVQIFPSGSDQRYDYIYTDRGNPLEFIAPFQPGTYELRYVHRDSDVIGTASFGVTETPVGLEGPTEVAVGESFAVTWTGPDANGDNVQIGPIGAPGYASYMYTDRGNPVSLTAPTEPGTYELRYSFRDRTIIYSHPIEVIEVLATVSAPANAVAGSNVTVDWTGPGYDRDYIGIGKVGADGPAAWQTFSYAKDGNPAQVLVPITPGDYEISYFLGQDRSVLATAPLTVTPVSAALTAPAEAVAGSTITVDWEGPSYDRDYIGIGVVDADGPAQWENFFYTTDGTPGQLLIPTTPGAYEISYFAGQDRTILTTIPISVTDVTASLTLPDTAVAGSTIEVVWTGPDYDRDYVGIGVVDADGPAQWENFFYTKDGNPGELLMPTTPGDYVVSYFNGQDRSILTSASLTVTDVTAQLTAPAEASAGSTISVEWTGPGYDRDYVGIGVAGTDGPAQWENFFYTSDGSPGQLLVPTTPGDYLISYFSGQDRSILTSVAITVTEISATITAPDSATAGSSIAVDWNGPNLDGDYIGIGLADASGPGRWENFAYTRNGAPSSVLVPTTPGDYLITYFMGQDRSVLKARPITVTPLDNVRLLAEETAAAGSDLVVGWDGPDYDGDYIGIGLAGSDGPSRWQAYAYTSDGNPVAITLPDAPGDYVITYFLGQDRSTAATRSLTIE